MCSHIQTRTVTIANIKTTKKGNAQNEVFVRQSVTHVRFITDESLAKIHNQFFLLMTLRTYIKKMELREKEHQLSH